MATSRPEAGEARPASPRRRGPVLERAILQAALEQLSAAGWRGLTMEGVAARAQTGKAAVYRRWPTKGDLVADALRTGLPDLAEAPDCGSLREDLLRLCARLREAMYSRSGNALRAVLDECGTEEAERFHVLILEGVVEPGKRLMTEVVRRGMERGEVRADATGDLVADVVPALLMYRHKVSGARLREQDVLDVVDQVMMPLLSPRSG